MNHCKITLFCGYVFIAVLAILCTGWVGADAQAQDAQISIELQISDNLSNSQVIDLTNIIANQGRGPNLFSLFIQNEDDANRAENLYLDLKLRSSKRGVIAEGYQVDGKPFSLNARQRVYATNNTIENGLPGVREDIEMDGGLTAEGERFVNDLGGSTVLPADTYTIELSIYQGNNSRLGGVLVASASADIGGEIVDDIRDIYLTTPGDVVGADAVINNPLPEFRWEGAQGTQYRLVVVEARGQDSPEALLQGALSTSPILRNGNPGTGSLLEHEILDVSLRSTSFQMPTSGVQSLKPGSRYYWQVIAELRSSNETVQRASEIWSFSLPRESGTAALNEELSKVLRSLLGRGQLERLRNQGFRLESIELEGVTITGPQALEELIQLLNRVEEGEITIEGN